MSREIFDRQRCFQHYARMFTVLFRKESKTLQIRRREAKILLLYEPHETHGTRICQPWFTSMLNIWISWRQRLHDIPTRQVSTKLSNGVRADKRPTNSPADTRMVGGLLLSIPRNLTFGSSQIPGIRGMITSKNLENFCRLTRLYDR
jgi:hypothetical protein